jgi:hypothetical protein
MFGDHQSFFGLEMLENPWQPPNIFKVENARKRMAIAKHFLDQKC